MAKGAGKPDRCRRPCAVAAPFKSHGTVTVIAEVAFSLGARLAPSEWQCPNQCTLRRESRRPTRGRKFGAPAVAVGKVTGLIESARRAASGVLASQGLESRERKRCARNKGMGAAAGLQRAVVVDVWVGDEGEIVVAARPDWRERDRCGVCRRRSRRLIWATVVGGGVRWISARSSRSWRPRRRELSVGTAWWSARSRGHVTTRGSRVR
jgi:hypothetical protein